MKRGLCDIIFCSLLLLILSISKDCKAQDIHFSQFYETPLLRNPALAGLFSGDIRIAAVYRTQWQSVTTPYQTGSLDGEFKLPVGKANDFITLGGEMFYDEAGSISLKATDILPALNYHKSLSDNRNMYLSLGFMAGIDQRSFDASKITTGNQYIQGLGYVGGSTGEQISKSSYSYFDGSTGLSFNTQLGNKSPNDNMYIGIAYFHFNQATNTSFYGSTSIQIIPKWVFSGGARMSTSDNSFITFEGDYSKQGSYTETILGGLYTLRLENSDDAKYLLDFGAFLRVNDAIIPVVKIEMKPLAISLSYDANVSTLTSASNGVGGFELGLVYQTYYQNNSSRDAVRCPRF
ncbi:MAG: PorP/SprF family type IX secretion system membrane protein [Ferruginibacter sp.]